MIGLLLLAIVCATSPATATGAPAAGPPGPVDHDVVVRVTPATGELAWVDRLRPPAAMTELTLELHPGLVPQVEGARITHQSTRDGVTTLVLARSADVVVVTAAGKIVEPPVQQSGESQRSFQETRGTIEGRGVYLSPQSRWLPVVVGDDGRPLLVTGQILVEQLPAGWSALSEGDQQKNGAWREKKAIDGFHLIAGPFTTVSEKRRGVDVMIWLRRVDAGGAEQGREAGDAAALADRYLEVTGQYLEQYETLIGKYPYGKFALVENFWETGYGMPSFTVLGSQVLRFPFILHTSWPHELLHNWWGNGVFVSGGNWSEGLTAYLADHLHAEQEGKGAEHRRTTLQRYLDFVDVDDANDFAVADFGARNSAASEAVGYGKTLMIFHMVRRQIGDAAFKKGLQRLWNDKQQQRASFDDVAAAFSAASGSDLRPFFAAWTTQTGIPTLALRELQQATSPAGVRTVSVVVEQTQAGPIFPLEVPVVLTLVDGRSLSTRITLTGRSGRGTVQVAAAVARVDVDPFFDVFRRLLPTEVPPSLSRALGAKKMLFVLPSFASADERAAWKGFALALCPDITSRDTATARCRTVDDKDLGTLPSDAAVWVLGYGSYLRGGAYVFSRPQGIRFDDHGLFPPGAWERVVAAKDRLTQLKAERVDTGQTGLALVFEHPRNPALALAFVGAPNPAMVPLLARKIPHYGKYAYVGFAGADATNNLKGQWSTSSSPLTFFPASSSASSSVAIAVKEPPALIALPPPFDGGSLLATVTTLADAKMQGRGRNSAGLQLARSLIDEKLKDSGIKDVSIVCDAVDTTVCNVVAHLPGADPKMARVVLGAHLDHLGLDKQGTKKARLFPGADDNASGVAVVLEVARQLNKSSGARPVDVVFFDAEEAGRLGSISYVANSPTGSIHSMVNLDVVGRLADQKPLLILDGASASEWVHVARGVGFTTGVAVELAPQGGGASDQQSFIDKGIPAIQLFSGPNADYHQASDTAEKVSPSSLVKAAVVAREIVMYLRDRPEPLSFAGAGSGGAGAGASGAARKASLGSVPDMSFAGPGVRFDDVVAGSGAAAAGLVKGDVLVRFDNAAVTDLKGYSALLKQRQPGDRVKVVVLRAGKEVAVDVVLGAR